MDEVLVAGVDADVGDVGGLVGGGLTAEEQQVAGLQMTEVGLLVGALAVRRGEDVDALSFDGHL